MKHISITFNAKIKSYEKINDQFTKCKCYVQALGKNRNMTHFSKAAVTKALPTLFNIPVVGHLIENEDGSSYFGGHDVEIDMSGENIVVKSLCVPYGVVPYQENITFETLIEKDGSKKEYLVADIILWTGRYPELMDAIYSDEVYFNQSMEIDASEWEPLEDDAKYLDVKDFTYSALCLLGKADDVTSQEHTEPCFPLSCVIPYSLGATEKFYSLMDELKTELKECFASHDFYSKGGNILTTEIRDSILAEFECALEELDFEIAEDMTEEDFRARVEEFKNSNHSNENENEDNNGQKDDSVSEDFSTETFASTYEERRNAIREALKPIIVPHVATTYFWLMDFDDKYIYVEKEVCSNDVELYSRDTGRMTYVFDEESLKVTGLGAFEEMIVKWLTLDENKQIEAQREEYEQLKLFKEERLKAEHEAEVNAVMDNFSDLAENEEFIQLKETAYSYTDMDALQNMCFAIRGKTMKVQKPISNTPLKQALDSSDPEMTPNYSYGGLFEKYGRK